MSVDQNLLLIRNYDLWAHISEEEYEALNLVHNFIEANKNEFIYFDAHFHNKLYFLKDGFIKIGYFDDSGREIVKEIIRKGEVFGQITLERNNLQGEFAKAYKANVSLCAFNIEDFEKICAVKPTISLRYSRLVGTQLKKIENRLVNLLHKDVRTRLINFLLLLGSNATVTNNSVTFPIFLTHEDIAQLIGSSRQTVTTTLNELEASGLLLTSKGSMHLHDVKTLQKLATVS